MNMFPWSSPRRQARLHASLLSLACLTAATAGSDPACAPPPSGALAWYPAEGHADDLAGFHNGHAANGAAYTDGFVGQAFTFDGDDDVVGTDVGSAEQRAVRNTFSYELWARPGKILGNCPQSNTSNCSSNSLSWAIFPYHGDQDAPANEVGRGAGIGIAIGTDGVCVGEHAAFLVDCLARLDVPIQDWTHIAVVVENRIPRIYLDGVLAHTGIPAGKEFVFASWQVMGTGLSLGQYRGELDEVTVYGRALSDAEIATVAGAAGAGKCRPECPVSRTDDGWQGALVTTHSGVTSSAPDGMFGATGLSPESDTTLFLDAQADGTVHSIEWETATPLSLAGFGLFAFHDSLENTQRAFRRVRLQGRPLGGAYVDLYDQPIQLPYAPDSRELHRCVNLRPRLLQQFRAEFTQHGASAFSGPRVVELDAVGLPERVFRDGFEAPL